MKIDIFSHIVPLRYKEALFKIAPANTYLLDAVEFIPTLTDLDRRFRIMDKYEVMHVLTLAAPQIERVAGPEKAAYLASVANESLAELVQKYPDRFPAAVGVVALNNMNSALQEVDRAINDFKLRGILIYSSIDGKPLDLPEFFPLYEKMSLYNLPIWIHPMRDPSQADYPTEKMSLYGFEGVFGWPYETTIAMARLVLSGVLEKYPNLKFITHHAGAMVPFLEQRINCLYDVKEKAIWKNRPSLTRTPIEYFKTFYNDTALYGSTAGLRCAYEFFGADHLLFGTDLPYDNLFGERFTRQTILSIEQMGITEMEKNKIFADNARRLLRLPV